MTIADGTLAVFTFFNGLLFLAYVPQIAKVLKDQSGAETISFGTWALCLGLARVCDREPGRLENGFLASE